MTESKIRILIADDFTPMRRFVSLTLSKQRQVDVVGEATNGPEALRKSQELRPDVVLLDISLPEQNGFEVARLIREHLPNVKIIFFTQTWSYDLAEDAFQIGANGYVVKSDAGTELLPAVEAVVQGKRYVSRGLRAFAP